MLKRFGIVLAAAGLLALLPGPAFADHIKARKGAEAAAAAKVKARLVELGMTERAATDQVGALTPKGISYFAEDPSRVQLVGGLWGEEWVLGAGFLGTLILVGVSLLIRAKNN